MRWIAAVAICLVVSTSARAQDWGVTRDPFDPGLVRRYKAMLARDPHDEHVLRQLVAMYQQYRTVAKLEAEYRALLDSGEDWAALVVLARLPRTSQTESLSLWKRALAIKPDDLLGWLATGDASSGDAAAARDAYQHAAKLASEPRQKRLALTKLVRAAQLAGDATTVDGAYAELIALAPKDGTLWLDRGNAQLGAKHYAAAKDSFATAESLLRSDPEHQLAAMMNLGITLAALGQPDDAIAEYEHALDKVPSGYYLGAELVDQIVDVERKRKRLHAAVDRFEKRWPERARGYFEWATLADLYKETGALDHAIDAYRRALAKAPTEVTTQRKLIGLLDQVRPGEALAAHEAAARIAPGDADLQLELAKRYFPTQPIKAFATLEALARRMTQNINVRRAIAALYEQWNEPKRAIGEYEAMAAIEPKEPDHAIDLGDAYWRANDQLKARVAWQRLEKIGTPVALFRYGEVLAMHESWDEAAAAYTKSLALDGSNADALYGRARAYDSLKKYPAALEDARRAVALTANASYADGLRNRQMLVRVLGHAYTDGEHASLATAVTRWRFAFDHGDPAAGYLLAAHHARLDSPQQHDVLVTLHRQVPTDDSLAIALSRSFVHRRQFAQARRELEAIARRTPARGKEIASLIEQVDEERERAEQEIRWEEEGRSGKTSGSPDLVGRQTRVGARLELGTDVHRASGALLGVGLYHSQRIASGTAMVLRFDWTRRDARMEEMNAIALAGGVTRRIIDARKFEVAVGLAPRLELRFGTAESPWDRVALAGDATLELLPRALPATLGVRFDQILTEKAMSSAVLLELGFEVR